MVVVSHLFFFFDKKFGEGVTRYESHPPSLELSISRQPLFCYHNFLSLFRSVLYNYESVYSFSDQYGTGTLKIYLKHFITMRALNSYKISVLLSTLNE